MGHGSEHCSFCLKSAQHVALLIAGPDVFICDACAEVAVDMAADHRREQAARAVSGDAGVPLVRLGIDVGGTKIEGIALGQDGLELARRRVPTPRADYDATLGAIAELVGALEAGAGARRTTVGVGIPGTVSSQTGRVKNANSTWLNGRPFAADLEARLGRPVRVANDANCFVLSEATDGAAADAAVVFGVIVGTGTGAGVFVEGRVLVGPNAVAGEWGHNPLPWAGEGERPGPACYCGQAGCIETFLSGPGLAADFERHTGRRAAPETIAARAGEGDAEAEAALGRYEERMARALAAVINVLDPDVIVLGGGMSNLERLYERVPMQWARHVFSAGAAGEPVRTRLARARHGDASGVRGAAWLWDAR